MATATEQRESRLSEISRRLDVIGDRLSLGDALHSSERMSLHEEAIRLLRERSEIDRTENDNTNPAYPQVMPRINGKSFRCACLCNVFSEVEPLVYRCNACGEMYQGER